MAQLGEVELQPPPYPGAALVLLELYELAENRGQ
jgi:hypothetical protein